ncbi:MAG: site-specific integrase [Acidimicrobiia bacterium]|nr:site-specific integrase [Acidimicrobiia bacterium]
MASIRRRGDRWQALYRDPSARQRSRTFAKLGDARRYAASVDADLARGDWLDPKLAATTFAQWAETWSAGRVHLRESTKVRDDSIMRHLVLPYFGHRRMGQVLSADVQAFVAGLRNDGKAPATVRKAYQLAAAVLSSAVDSDLIGRSPCHRLKLPPLTRNEMRFLSQAEVAALAGVIDARYRNLVLTAAYTGLRFGELAGLRVGRLNMLARTATVAETCSEVGGQIIFGEPKTSASRRTITLPRFLVESLAEHPATQPTGPSDLVFHAPEGGPLHRTTFRERFWLPAVRASVGEPCRFHDLRHTHVALLIGHGEHPKVIQQRLGHASIRTTLDTYGHLFESLDEAVAERLDAAFHKLPVDRMLTEPPTNVTELHPQARENPS